ncbi:hypothetical protein SK128_008985 [Halocaridina rubra]|uniref:Uncharacterized protein n=1 Tax=Halocaridina rubra TaxID=373956 RepID=A0AAN8WZ68_HALRR
MSSVTTPSTIKILMLWRPLVVGWDVSLTLSAVTRLIDLSYISSVLSLILSCDSLSNPCQETRSTLLEASILQAGVAGLGTQSKTHDGRRGRTHAKILAKGSKPNEPVDEGNGERPKGKMISRFFQSELRQKRRLMGHLGAPGREEIYYDKDRAAAVAMGDQDIKTSLKVDTLPSWPISFN